MKHGDFGVALAGTQPYFQKKLDGSSFREPPMMGASEI